MNNKSKAATLIVLAATYAVSRVLFYQIGIRFDASSLNWYWQFLDVQVLQQRLLPALYHLHSQPPGFNLFLGVVLKLFPASAATCFAIIYMALGFLLYCSLYHFLRNALFSRPLAWACSFVFIVGPSCILYENWLFYSYPVSVVLTVAALALLKYEKTLRLPYAALFLACVTTACLTRSVYHLAFMVACTAFVIVLPAKRKSEIITLSLVAVLLVASLYVKNLCLFGFFGSSSWQGMNMAKIARHATGDSLLGTMMKEGEFQEIASIEPFSLLNDYSMKLKMSAPGCPDVPELTNPLKTAWIPNFNHREYIPVAKEYEKMSLWIIRRDFRKYLSAVFDAWLIYLQPCWQPCWYIRASDENRKILEPFTTFIRHCDLRIVIDLGPIKSFLFGCGPQPVKYPLTGFTLLIPFLLLASLFFVALKIRSAVKAGSPFPAANAFIIFTIVYVSVVVNMMEYGENNRFRAEINPLIYLVFVTLARRAVTIRLRPKD